LIRAEGVSTQIISEGDVAYLVPPKVNIRNVKDIHGELLTNFKNNKAVEIDLSACEDADLSLVQLIESARKSAAAQSKDVRLTKPAGDIVRAILDRAGLSQSFTDDDAKFWLHQEVL
jgi:anti-anti-sigma regulatory factor